jgi:hypothetical protein
VSLIFLYGCETWFLTLSENPELRKFENSVLRRIFVPKRDEIIGGYRKLPNEEIQSLYSLRNIIRMKKSRMIILEKYVTCMKTKRSACSIPLWKEINGET